MRAPSCRMRVNSGAARIRESRASAFAGWAPTGAPPPKSAVPTSTIKRREWRQRTSDARLHLDLVDEAPITPLRDDPSPSSAGSWPSDYAFSSFFSASMNRKSVPWASSF